MPASLVGQSGNATVSAAGAAPSGYLYGQPPTPGNLLVAFYSTFPAGFSPAVPTGWTASGGSASTQILAEIFWTIAVGNDAVPFFAGSGTQQQTIMLAEFAGVGPKDQLGTKAAGAGTISNPFAGPDRGANDLVVASNALSMSPAGPATTMVPSFNNGGVAITLYNDIANTQSMHSCFGYAIVTTHAVADTPGLSLSATGLLGASGAGVSFMASPNPNTPPLVYGTSILRRNR